MGRVLPTVPCGISIGVDVLGGLHRWAAGRMPAYQRREPGPARAPVVGGEAEIEMRQRAADRDRGRCPIGSRQAFGLLLQRSRASWRSSGGRPPGASRTGAAGGRVLLAEPQHVRPPSGRRRAPGAAARVQRAPRSAGNSFAPACSVSRVLADHARVVERRAVVEDQRRDLVERVDAP